MDTSCKLAPARELTGSEADEPYFRDFVFMAKEGLFSFDKTTPNNFNNTCYHLVAKPLNPLTLDKIPPEIVDILSKSIYAGNIDAFCDSSAIF